MGRQWNGPLPQSGEDHTSDSLPPSPLLGIDGLLSIMVLGIAKVFQDKGKQVAVKTGSDTELGTWLGRSVSSVFAAFFIQYLQFFKSGELVGKSGGERTAESSKSLGHCSQPLTS